MKSSPEEEYGNSQGSPVFLNVYDLTPLNNYSYWFGLGIFHSGIEDLLDESSCPHIGEWTDLTVRHVPYPSSSSTALPQPPTPPTFPQPGVPPPPFNYVRIKPLHELWRQLGEAKISDLGVNRPFIDGVVKFYTTSKVFDVVHMVISEPDDIAIVVDLSLHTTSADRHCSAFSLQGLTLSDACSSSNMPTAVHDMEYGFGAHDFPSSGVFEVEPKSCPGYIYRCSMFLGHTDMPPLVFRAFIETAAAEYHGDTYHLITKNCNHFTDDICSRLTGKHIPGWVNRLAHIEEDMSESLSTATQHEPTESDDADQDKHLLSPSSGVGDVIFIRSAESEVASSLETRTPTLH
ncbi:hypothetical protein Sjap_011266 [Stephania japonica]|uniref:PPPDE domain-containing protein n=1 Tax=Stephania japonica TaxID=461633 RepID=A0AAP0P5D9_9MAGN